jgi:hypothetical protein
MWGARENNRKNVFGRDIIDKNKDKEIGGKKRDR